MDQIIEMMANRMAEDNKVIEFNPNSVFEAMATPGFGNDAISKLSNKISIGLSNEISEIRNELIPEVKEYIGLVKQVVANVRTGDDIGRYEIKEVSIPDIVYELRDRKMLVVNNVRPMPVSTINVRFPENGTKELLKFNSPALDALLLKITKNMTDDQLDNIWYKGLTNVSKTNKYLNRLSTKPLILMQDIIVLLAYVINIKDEKPEGMGGTEEEYVAVMDTFYDNIISWIIAAEEKYKAYVKSNKVIISYPDRYTAIVAKDSYEKFLENASPEVILGAILKQVNYSYSDELFDHANTLSKFWDDKIKTSAIKDSQELVYGYITAYELAFGKWYDEVEEDLKPDVEKDILVNEIKDLIAGYKTSDILNIELIADSIFGKIIYAGTSYITFTESMYNYLKLNKNLTPQEAASYAAVELVLDYLLEQVDTRTLNG